MRTSTLLTAASVAALTVAMAPVVSHTPSLDDVPYLATDPRGDANGVNGQGSADIGLLVSEPASLPEADLLGARITSVFDGVEGADGLLDYALTGIEFRTALSADPTSSDVPIVHRTEVLVGGCRMWVQAQTGTGTPNAPEIRAFDGCGVTDDDETLTAGLRQRWDAATGELVVTLDLAEGDGRLTQQFRRGDVHEQTAAGTRFLVRSGGTFLTAPQFDEMPGGFAVIGADIPEDQREGEEPIGCDGTSVDHRIDPWSIRQHEDLEVCAGDTITWNSPGFHALVVDGTGEEIQAAASGWTATVEAVPGQVTYFCSVGTHRNSGMEVTVTTVD